MPPDPENQSPWRTLESELRVFPGAKPAHWILQNHGLERLDELFPDLLVGKRVWILTGRTPGRKRIAELLSRLKKNGASVQVDLRSDGEPTRQSVDHAVEAARAFDAETILAIGGGSTVDTAKAVAALVTNPGSVEIYLEGVGTGARIEQDPCPFVAVPTTAGTGAEMTKNAVIADYDKQYKKSFRDERMVAKAVLLDPSLTIGVPPKTTAAGSMDLLAQLLEPCLTRKRNEAVTRLAHHALQLCADAIQTVLREPSNLRARTVLLLCSAASGVCLANSGLTLPHGIASGGGALYPVPHGEWCGILLGHGLRLNRTYCESELQAAMNALFPTFCNDLDSQLLQLDLLREEAGLPADLQHLHLSPGDIRQLAEKSMGSSMNGNPLTMTVESVEAFLRPLC